ncbi:MAG: YajD family HNH nuclease [Gammaproteobacteria bacterium]|nr:YajD family HNH nuclease [Gammaproteobacteria bacterium]
MVKKTDINSAKLDKAVAEAQKARQQREKSYRERALEMYPWVCGKCQREFTRANLSELTVHHRDHNHDYNPPDGSNWELLCLYCHDNEHARMLDGAVGSGNGNSASAGQGATHNPFGNLKAMLEKKK